MTPYYEDDFVTLYHGDWRDLPVDAWQHAAALVTDPPYGIDYHSGSRRKEGNARSIRNDQDTATRDYLLACWNASTEGRTALVFGSPRVEKPIDTKGVLVWDKGGALGMGDLSIPWKFDHEEIYVLGGPWSGRRDSGSVLRCPPVQSVGRAHPHQKPQALIVSLLLKVPTGLVFDPFAGSGTTLRAAKYLGRRAIGAELDEAFCERAAGLLGQETLDFGGVA